LLWGQSSSVLVAAPPSASPSTQLCPEAQAQTDVTVGGRVPPVPCDGAGEQVQAPLQTGAGAGEPLQAAASARQTPSASLRAPGRRRNAVSRKRYFATW